MRSCNTPGTYGRRGGARAIVTHHGPMTGGRTGGQIRVWLDAVPDAGHGIEKPDSPPKARRMATLVTSPVNLKTCTAL